MHVEERDAIRAMSGLFTTATLRALAAPTPWDAAERFGTVDHMMSADAPLATVFDQAYQVLERFRRSEYVFKNSVVSKIVFGRHRPTTASAALEFALGASVADVVVFNGTITAYEIKTDFDSFARLPTQLADYAAVAEFTYVVTSANRVTAALDAVPAHVGVMALTARGFLSVRREATRRPDLLSHRGLFAVLRSAERAELFRIHSLSPADTSTRAAFEAFTTLHLGGIYQDVTKLLKRRFSDAAVAAGAPGVPESLRALMCGTPLSSRARDRLSERLAQRPAALLESS
ncbi:sce7726 family protein [Microbacterium sp. W1N]|uniref:sce7726 family protein n=1 Tax=Microbacterium festucae TaxID=2977531 RepID=UPI0021C20058|nr:sce7726 family protein [Microbacterium festucae]MCT9819287.1 sce7726 family protein [Microbacterium festucae]